MNWMKFFSIVCLAGTMALPVLAQDKAKTIAFAGHEWDVTAQEAQIVDYLDEEALHLTQGRVWLDGDQFSDGVIKFDVAYDDGQGFVGFLWRNEDRNRYEEIYFRAHLAGKPDAVQYTPVENKNSAWQIFTDENAVTGLNQKFGEWNKVKLVVKGDKADLYFNSDEPALHIPDLKTDLKNGGIGLRVSSGQNKKEAYFSNFSFRPLKSSDEIIGQAKPDAELPSGLISSWKVSSNVAEDDLKSALLPAEIQKDLNWTMLNVETNGIANLSKVANRDRKNNTVFVKLNIDAEMDKVTEFQFGYSDRARIYVNGKLAYSGENGWHTQDHRYYGTVGLFDSIGLDLKKGDNEVWAAISENFGGWAFVGAIEDQEGLNLIP